jgi:hypothetical protein
MPARPTKHRNRVVMVERLGNFNPHTIVKLKRRKPAGVRLNSGLHVGNELEESLAAIAP